MEQYSGAAGKVPFILARLQMISNIHSCCFIGGGSTVTIENIRFDLKYKIRFQVKPRGAENESSRDGNYTIFLHLFFCLFNKARFCENIYCIQRVFSGDIHISFQSCNSLY